VDGLLWELHLVLARRSMCRAVKNSFDGGGASRLSAFYREHIIIQEDVMCCMLQCNLKKYLICE
jgi:hypothetical protein